MADQRTTATVMAGIPAGNNSLFHRLQFNVGDPAAWIDIDGRTTMMVRDIEMQRARSHAVADAVVCPADFTPQHGLSGDRETATAQALAELLRRAEVTTAIVDRTFPTSFAHELGSAGIAIDYDAQLGVAERRAKGDHELDALREAQSDTEAAMEMACRLVANASADAHGVLHHDGAELTSERVRNAIDVFLLARNYSNPSSIVACGPQCADCHEKGTGPLRTAESVIIDIFPRNRSTLYNGDCTRTVVHGDVPDAVVHIHRIVAEAKASAIAVVRAGATGEQVHQATIDAITAHGYPVGPPSDAPADDFVGMVHGTGHGVGLDVHEPPLLDLKGPELVVGDVLTVEPGLYGRLVGGVRIEDMVAVTVDGCENFNTLHEGLDWSG
ncbi:MAG: hypothetical protein CMJ24_00080 [Phycisphaerae bacterium]|nr:hypothetical protein [Phycisphaerae bacterium]